MKIVDLEGHEIATYGEARVDGKPRNGFLGLAFACYTANPQPFTFLTTGDGDRIEIRGLRRGANFVITVEVHRPSFSWAGKWFRRPS